MLLPRWSVACLALLASVSGCSGSSEPKVTLYPVVDERGLITYVTSDPNGPEAQEARRIARLQQQDDEARRQRKEQADRDLISWRDAKREQTLQELRQMREERAPSPVRRRDILVEYNRNMERQQPSPGYVPSGEAMSARLERESRQHDQLLTRMNWQMQEQAQREARQQGLGQR